MSWILDLFKEIPLSSVLKEKLTIADTRIKELETENTTLRQQLNDANMREQQLNEKIAIIEREKQQLHEETYKTKKLPQIDLLDETKTQILIAIAKHEHCNYYRLEPTLNFQLNSLGMKPLIRSSLEHRLREMKKDKYIIIAQSTRGPDEYSLDERGGKYLDDNNLWPSDGERGT